MWVTTFPLCARVKLCICLSQGSVSVCVGAHVPYGLYLREHRDEWSPVEQCWLHSQSLPSFVYLLHRKQDREQKRQGAHSMKSKIGRAGGKRRWGSVGTENIRRDYLQKGFSSVITKHSPLLYIFCFYFVLIQNDFSFLSAIKAFYREIPAKL